MELAGQKKPENDSVYLVVSADCKRGLFADVCYFPAFVVPPSCWLRSVQP
jgi:hypothetical protein